MTTGQSIVNRAKLLLGVPYLFGAKAHPNTKKPAAIDCSGFTYWVFRRFEIKLPHGSFNQVNCSAVRPCTVAHALATPGALVFHRSLIRKRIDHVGISDGEGGVIEATPPKVRHKNPTRPKAWFTGRLVQGVHY